MAQPWSCPSSVSPLPWRSSPPPPLASFRSQQEAHSVSDRPIELCSAGASATCRAPPVPSLWHSRNHLSLWSTLTFRDFCHQAATHVTWEMHLGYTPDSSVSFPLSVCLLPEVPLLLNYFSFLSSLLLSFPRALQPGMLSASDQGRRVGSQLGQASCRSAGDTERPSAKLTVLLAPPPVSVPSQGPCCGPVLLFTQPPPDPLNCR